MLSSVDVSNNLRWIERTAWVAGVVALTIWGGAAVARHLGSARELQRFQAARKPAPQPLPAISFSAPNTELWDPKRIAEWRATQTASAPPPLAVLRIPRLGVEAPVLEGTDDWTLNRGVGHIEDTAAPGVDGNVGIAGHRDGFFRPLKDVTTGDLLEVETRAGVAQYHVDHVWIVDPDEVSVLDPTPLPAVTLVTCYPFYYVGSAPQRFIVRAVRADATGLRAARQ